MTTATDYLTGGGFAFESDDSWAKIPNEYKFPECAGVEVDDDDNVYIFNRGPHPVVVLDKNGNFVRSFGEETFTARAHGIHISPDDFEGRKIGSTCGKEAWALAQRYFDGSAVG